jgi:hypothetical protein
MKALLDGALRPVMVWKTDNRQRLRLSGPMPSPVNRISPSELRTS